MGGAGACTRTRVHTRALCPQTPSPPYSGSLGNLLPGPHVPAHSSGSLGTSLREASEVHGDRLSPAAARDTEAGKRRVGLPFPQRTCWVPRSPEHPCIPHLTLSSQGGLGGPRALLPSPLATTRHLMQGFGREALFNTE